MRTISASSSDANERSALVSAIWKLLPLLSYHVSVAASFSTKLM